MTDEESRKAFDSYVDLAMQKNLDGRSAAQDLWQAAVAWAMQRERERCAKIAEYYEDKCLATQIKYDYSDRWPQGQLKKEPEE